MGTEREISGPLGAAFLIVFATSLAGGLLGSAATGPGGMEAMLRSAAANGGLIAASAILQLATCVGVVFLAAFLHLLLRRRNERLALVALGLWVAEAFALALSAAGLLGFRSIGADLAASGASAAGYLPLGNLAYYGLFKAGAQLHMFFYCAGGLIWYPLLAASRCLPRAISAYGCAAVAVALGGNLLGYAGIDLGMATGLPIAPFELALGAWLLIRGTRWPAAAE